MASATMWKLRRLAPRAVRVINRQVNDSRAIKAYEETLIPKAQTFMTAYDQSARYEATARSEMKEGKGAIDALLKNTRSWLPLVQRDIVGFDSSDFGDKPGVPDDVIEDADRLYDVVHDYSDQDGKPLRYQEACLGELEPAIQLATNEWTEAEAADKTYQDLLGKVRSSAEVFDTEIQAFRKTLASIVGRSDKDYQKLRSKKAQALDEDDDPQAPEPPPVVAPAPPEVDTPEPGTL